MKNKMFFSIVAIALMLVTTSVTSCKKDTDDTPKEAPIIGTWTCNSPDGFFSMTFKTDKTGLFTAPWGSSSFTYTDTGSVIVMNFSNGESDSISYTVSGNTLTATIDGETLVFNKQ